LKFTQETENTPIILSEIINIELLAEKLKGKHKSITAAVIAESCYHP
jgi:hypothetical protein